MTGMTGDIPDSVLRTWPTVPAEKWQRLSEHRYQAPHNVDGYVECVVVAFGETIGRAAQSGDEREVYAGLFDLAARLGARRTACESGTPVVRPDNEANAGVVGRCWWCGKWPDDHTGDGACGRRMSWGGIVRDGG